MNMKQRLDDLLAAGVKNGHVPGVVAALVDKDGLTYIGSAGERTIGTGDVMTTDTVGAIASMTKAITGAAVMQLVEQGRLDLDAPAETYCAVVPLTNGISFPRARCTNVPVDIPIIETIIAINAGLVTSPTPSRTLSTTTTSTPQMPSNTPTH